MTTDFDGVIHEFLLLLALRDLQDHLRKLPPTESAALFRLTRGPPAVRRGRVEHPDRADAQPHGRNPTATISALAERATFR